jgi:hypothetical protein
MFNVKRSLIALVGPLVLVGVVGAVMPHVVRGQGQGHPPFAQRTFYLTQTQHNGSQALTACAQGYHMASLWEIFDTSNLRYNTTLGFTQGDSGFGPPSAFTIENPVNAEGWIRTGVPLFNGGVTGQANCLVWTDNSAGGIGTVVFLENLWGQQSPTTVISPWVAGTRACSSAKRVWCVQD